MSKSGSEYKNTPKLILMLNKFSDCHPELFVSVCDYECVLTFFHFQEICYIKFRMPIRKELVLYKEKC